jgi:hypothetical protein
MPRLNRHPLLKKPWLENYRSAILRCYDQSDENYKYCGKIGIEVKITPDEIKQLWDRDGAGNMKQPCLKRIDKNGHYEFSNCKFEDWKSPKIIETIKLKYYFNYLYEQVRNHSWHRGKISAG